MFNIKAINCSFIYARLCIEYKWIPISFVAIVNIKLLQCGTDGKNVSMLFKVYR